MTFFNTYTTKFNTKFAGVFYARSKILLAIAGILLLSLLFACHKVYGGRDAGNTYSVGATVKGHTGEVSLTLIYGNDDKTETLNVPIGAENFTFDAKLGANQSFALNVIAPAGQTCSPSLAGGVIIDADVTDIEVTCEAVYSVGATVSGLSDGDSITLTLTPTGGTAEDKTITGDVDESTDDTFAFDTKLVDDATYTVTINSQMNKICTVDNAGTQTIVAADANITVTCVAVYSVGATVSGLAEGDTITLTLSPTGATAEDKAIIGDADESTDDTFTFDTVIANGATYTVTTTSPTGKTCTVAPAGTQVIGGADANISVTCVTGYFVGGTVTGATDAVTLRLAPTGGVVETFTIPVSATTFTFATELQKDDKFRVFLVVEPAGQICTVTPRVEQTMGEADFTNIIVTCNTEYFVSGTVTGAAINTNTYIVLTVYDDNTGTGGISRSIRANADGTFTFTGVHENKFYSLQASSRTVGETCSGVPNTPTLVTAGVTDAQITCTASTHTGPFVSIYLESIASVSSLATVNFFVGDTVIPDTSGIPTQVVNGSDADVVIIPNIDGSSNDGFFYDISIDVDKYYALVVTTSATETCPVGSGRAGGPVTNNVSIGITCQ